MIRTLSTSLLIFLYSQSVIAQSVRTFELKAAGYQVENSFYRHIEYLDSRHDTTQIGIIGLGPLKDIDAKLVLKSPFAAQLARLVADMTDSTAKEGALLFQLKKFSFVETYGTRYCYLDMAMYARYGERYKALSSLDTVMVIAGGDVNRYLQKVGNIAISDFIAAGLIELPTDSNVYTFDDVMHIDSIEKRRIPLYNTDTYTDGIYTQYASFRRQAPDWQGIVKARGDGTITSVRVADPSGNKVKLKQSNIYAVVYKGQPFIVTEYGFYPLEKIFDEFYFTGDVRVAASQGDVMTGQIAFGLVGAALASKGSEGTYYLMIDHQNGRLVHLKAIEHQDNGN